MKDMRSIMQIVEGSDPPFAKHMTTDKGREKILKTGRFTPSKEGWLGPGLYAHLHATGKEGKGAAAVFLSLEGLKLSDGGKPDELSREQWARLASKPASDINKQLAKLGYDGLLDESKGWVLIFPTSCHKIAPLPQAPNVV